jgi:hypothetical protein
LTISPPLGATCIKRSKNGRGKMCGKTSILSMWKSRVAHCRPPGTARSFAVVLSPGGLGCVVVLPIKECRHTAHRFACKVLPPDVAARSALIGVCFVTGWRRTASRFCRGARQRCRHTACRFGVVGPVKGCRAPARRSVVVGGQRPNEARASRCPRLGVPLEAQHGSAALSLRAGNLTRGLPCRYVRPRMPPRKLRVRDA